jgi:hypothetical protein
MSMSGIQINPADFNASSTERNGIQRLANPLRTSRSRLLVS